MMARPSGKIVKSADGRRLLRWGLAAYNLDMTQVTVATKTRLPKHWTSRYQIIESKGAGGFGRVLRARDSWLERDIAVKVLDPLMALSEAEIKRFRQEARILAKLSHPHIPAIYDVVFETAEDSEDGTPHFQIIFEYIEGLTLREYLHDEGPAPLGTALRWFYQLASALHHAHSLKVIHRDVKPSNIVLRSGLESCSLVDFGIALSADEAERLTKRGYAIGTPGYMSPEQAAGEDVDHLTDIFSLGVCLYEALSGAKLQPAKYKPIASINEIVPPAIDDLVLRCLEPRDRRLADVATFSSELLHAVRRRVALSDILAEGKLSDLDAALGEMTAIEFSERPAGQRALIISKVEDLAEAHEARLEYPLINLLVRLVHLGARLRVGQYEQIIHMALECGFDRVYSNGRTGDVKVRRAIADEAGSLPPANHAMVARTVLEFFKPKNLLELDEWQLNGARDTVNNLMANRACEQQADELTELRAAINAAYREVRDTSRS